LTAAAEWRYKAGVTPRLGPTPFLFFALFILPACNDTTMSTAGQTTPASEVEPGGSAEAPPRQMPPPPGRSPSRAGFRSKESLSKMAAEYNKTLPIMVARNTELMDMAADEGVLIYNYRITDVCASPGQFDTDAFLSSTRPLMINAACADPQTRELLDQLVTLRYYYYDKERQYIFSFDVKPSDCGF
jgi:hypothetical protein